MVEKVLRRPLGTLVRSPLGGVLLTGQLPQGPADQQSAGQLRLRALSDERRLDAVEQLIPVAQEAGMPLVHHLLHRDLAASEEDHPTLETEAEGVAYAVLSYFGVHASEYSFAYVAHWGE